MTMARYRAGCAPGSKVPGLASADASDEAYAWNVDFHYGNADLNHRSNHAWVRAVRSFAPASECHGALDFEVLYKAMRRAAEGKRPSCNQLAFCTRWIDGIADLEARITDGTWRPAPTLCFVSPRPKAREIHAPDFSDRVLHHAIVPPLEAIYEPTFCTASYSNRKGKGTHAAVNHLQALLRQVHSGQGGGWYLQLDIANFFNSIHRPTLWHILKRRMQKHGVSIAIQRCVHALLRHPLRRTGVRYRSTPAERALVPAHKRLENAAPGCGIPIGNLSSQFFANVYLDRLDQFVKHALRARRYVRYVDDFVLVHHDRRQLEAWRDAIADFLARELQLKLKPDIRLRRIETGVDFLGYIVRPTHKIVRRRVAVHATEAVREWGRRHVRGDRIHATPAELARITSSWLSYRGHFEHAASVGLIDRITTRFPWLPAATRRGRRYPPGTEHQRRSIAWQPPARNRRS